MRFINDLIYLNVNSLKNALMKKIVLLLFLFISEIAIPNNISLKAKELDSKSLIDSLLYPKVVNQEFDNDFLLEFINDQDPKVKKAIGEIKSSISEINKTGNYVGLLGAESMITLPVGVKKKIGKNDFIMGVSKAKFHPNYTEVTLFVKLTLQQLNANNKQTELFFGADNVKISHSGGIYGDANITLLGDIAIPINGRNSVLELKGGFNMKTGVIDKKTYLNIDCSGIKEIGLAADVKFSKNLLQPLTNEHKIIKHKNVIGSFETKVSDWNDILAEVNISDPFQITDSESTTGRGKGGLVFEVKKAVFDFSDFKNSSNVDFPKSYKEKYLIPGNEELWRGVFIESISISLPKEFKKAESTEKIFIDAKKLILDAEGITGQFSAENVLSLNEGNAGGWPISVEDLYVNLEANKIVGGGFGGKVVLPLSGELTQEQADKMSDEEVSKKVLRYEAVIDPQNEEYTLSLQPIKELSFNALGGQGILTPNSKLELKIIEGKFKPKANLYGTFSVNASNKPLKEGEEGVASFKGITFENLQLQTETPYLSVDYMGYEEEVKLGGFPVTIKEIGLKATDTEAGLYFDLDVNLMDKGFSGETHVGILAKNHLENNRQKWKFHKIDIKNIEVRADLGSVKFRGSVEIKSDDPVYGNGFYGELEADFNDINVLATAWFGRTDVRYWYVDAYVDFSAKPIKPTLGTVTVNGFGGGAYYHMKKTTKPPKLVYQGEVKDKKPVQVMTPGTPSGVDYVPDSESGLGFRAMLGFELPSGKAFNGKIGFEMAFNSHGGLNNILFFGEAHIMKENAFKFGDKFKEKLKGMEEKINAFGENNAMMNELKETNLVEYSKVSFPQDGLTFDVGIDAHFSMVMDFQNKSFHAEMEVYLNTPGGLIKGVGERGKAGWAVFHTGPDGWYIHMGTPKDRIGVKVGIGAFSVKATTYFMIGDKIPGSPAPPNKVAEILKADSKELDYMRDLNLLGEGRGFAIGMDLSVDTGEMNFLMFYARFAAGLGFDIMIKDNGKTACKGSGQIGIDGWYANGQAYVYLQGELGIKVNLWFIKGKFPILKAGAAALLQAKLPNPSWFRGYIGGNYDILNGLVKGEFRFKLELGEECEMINGAPLGGLKIISGVTPENDTNDIDVFTAPQAAFNMKINKEFELEDDKGVKTYKILLEEFIVTKEGKKIAGELEWNASNDVVNFISYDVLPPKSTLKVKVTVSFKENRSGAWITLMYDGKKATEIEERTFVTGEAPDYIPEKNIVYAYPVINQSYFYQKESTTGYVKLQRGQPYLFAPESEWLQKVNYSNEETGEVLSNTNVSYNTSKKLVSFNFNKFDNNQTYTLSIISHPLEVINKENNITYTKKDTGQEGNTIEIKNKTVQTVTKSETETKILTYKFKTSEYNTFADKVKDKKILQHYLEPIYSDVHAIQTDVEPTERFSNAELEGDKYTADIPLVSVEAVLDDSYYKDRIYQLIYEGYPLEEDFTFDRDTDVLGIPPKKSVDILTWYGAYLRDRPNYSLLDYRIPFRYHLPYAYKQDFIDIRYKVVNKYLNEPEKFSTQLEKYNYLITGVFPAIRSGKYKVKMQYVMPGDILGSSTIFKYKNPF